MAGNHTVPGVTFNGPSLYIQTETPQEAHTNLADVRLVIIFHKTFRARLGPQPHRSLTLSLVLQKSIARRPLRSTLRVAGQLKPADAPHHNLFVANRTMFQQASHLLTASRQQPYKLSQFLHAVFQHTFPLRNTRPNEEIGLRAIWVRTDLQVKPIYVPFSRHTTTPSRYNARRRQCGVFQQNWQQDQ